MTSEGKAMIGKVRILGCEFELRPGDPKEMRGRWGRFDLQNRTIIYATHMAESAIRETVFHELVHAADMSVSTEKTELTEEQINRISAMLFGVLRDHADLVEWLMDES